MLQIILLKQSALVMVVMVEMCMAVAEIFIASGELAFMLTRAFYQVIAEGTMIVLLAVIVWAAGNSTFIMVTSVAAGTAADGTKAMLTLICTPVFAAEGTYCVAV